MNPRTNGTLYSTEEADAIKKCYLEEHMKIRDIVDLINKKFWNGHKVRTYKSIENKVLSSGWARTKHSDYISRATTPKIKEMLRLKKAGKSQAAISEMMNVPLGTIKSSLNYIKTKTIYNDVEDQKKEYVDDEDLKECAHKEELQRRIEMLEKDLAKSRAVNSIIIDTVKNSIAVLKPLKIPTIIISSKKMHKAETAMLELGDLHIGEKIVKEEVANVTEYNFDIFCKRLDVLTEGIAECINIQRSKIPIDTLDINVLGDIVTGENIYLGQTRNTDMMLMDQTFEGANRLANRLILPCAQMFNKVRLRCVWGNHGRVGKPGEFHQKTNFDYIVYVFLKEVLKRQKNVEFYIAECPVMLFKLPEAPSWTHLISHGNEVGSWMSIPFYGMERDHGKYMQLFGMNINYWHLAHHHRACRIDVPYGERLLNGTFVGGSELSVMKMKTLSQPKQLFFGFNEKRGITWRYDIQLDTMKQLGADHEGIYTPHNTTSDLVSSVNYNEDR